MTGTYLTAKKGTLAALVAAGALLASGQAMATPTLELSSGATTITVTDGGAGDSNAVAGAVTFIGAVGNFIINVTTGLTKPAIGSAIRPDMDLNSVDTSSPTGGTLTIKFSETGFAGSGSNIKLASDVGGTTQGTVDFDVYIDGGNALFGQGTQIADLGPFSGGAFSGSTSSVVSPAGPYSITQIATIIHGSGTRTSSFDLQTTVPVPATLGLLGAALFGLGILGRRRTKTA